MTENRRRQLEQGSIGQDAGRRIRWTTRMEDRIAVLTNRVRQLGRQRDLLPVDIRDDIEIAKHYHDKRIDEIWTVLVRAGLLPSHELHHTIRDNSDVWGRVEGCEHCAPDLERTPFQGSVTDRIEADQDRIRHEMRDFWGEDDE